MALTDITRLTRHHILCGAGRTGQNIIMSYCQTRKPLVIIDSNPAAIEQSRQVAAAYNITLPAVLGDATEDETLQQAGVERAEGLVAALNEDRDNLFTILTARSLNSTLRIVTCVNDEASNREKLEKAGASKVVSADVIGGMRIASEMVRPVVAEFLDQMSRERGKDKTLRFTELPLSQIKTPELKELIEDSKQPNAALGLCIKDIGKYTGLLVVAIKPAQEQINKDTTNEAIYQLKKRYRFAPRGDTDLHADDVLMVIGTQDKLEEVTQRSVDALDSTQKNA
jgi:voltage-gated potassium channel